MRRRLMLASMALLSPALSRAQPAGRPRVMGILVAARPAGGNDPMLMFIAALAELGWVDGKTITIVRRSAELRYDSFPERARELVDVGVDLLVVNAGVTGTLAAKQATSTIPILAIGVADPVKFGLVATLARPGGNVTGFAATTTEWGKYLELAREAVPSAGRVAVIANPTNVSYQDYVTANESAARQLGFLLQMIPVSRADQLVAAFEAMKRERADVLIFGPDPVYFTGSWSAPATRVCPSSRRFGRLPNEAPSSLSDWTSATCCAAQRRTRTGFSAAPSRRICRSCNRPGSSW